jgi:competence protein ComEC
MAEATGRDKRDGRRGAGGQARRLALWTPVLLGLGVQGYFAAPVEPPPLIAAAALALAAAVVWRRRGRETAQVAAIAALCVALGFAAALARAHLVAAPVLTAEREMLVEGRVAALSQSQAGRPRALLTDPVLYGVPEAATPARVRVVLPEGESVAPGDWISVMARLGPPQGPAEPGAYDFARAAWFDRLGAVGVAAGPVARIDGPAEGAGSVGMLDTLRSRLSDGLRAGVGGEAGAFAAAVTVGDRFGLPPEAVEALRVSGLAHLLAISGLHMAIVCGLVFASVRLGLVALLGARAPAKRWAAVAALAAAGAYLLISGASTSTVRAFVMAAVVFGAVLADRQALTMRALAVAAFGVLLLTPEALLEVGFQMSFAATAALVAAYEAARDRGALGWRPPDRGPVARLAWSSARFVGATLATSLVAGLATAPFAAAAFNRASVYGLLANLLGVPAMGLVVAPALAASAFLAPFGLEGPPLAVAGAGVDWILAVARMVAALDGAQRAVPAAPPIALWLIVLGGLWLCLWRGALRLAAAPALALGLLLWVLADRPAALVTASGAAVGVMGPEGRAVLAGVEGRFAVETWLRRDGDAATVDEATARPGFRRDGPWRDADTPRGGVHVYLGDRPPAPPALGARCVAGAVVIAPRWRADAAAGPLPCLLVDASTAPRKQGGVIVHDHAGPALRLSAPAVRLWRPDPQ